MANRRNAAGQDESYKWEMKGARTAKWIVTGINSPEECVKCGRCRCRLRKGEPWEAPGRCMKCGIYIDGIIVE